MIRYAVFGFNRMSVEAINRLDCNCVIVVDQAPERLKQAEEKGLTTAPIDFRSDEDLKSIGIGKDIKTLFCFFPEDSDNVFLTLSARAIDPELHIVSIVDDPDAEDKLLAAGANKVINPYQICGRKIYEWIKKPDITNIIDHTVFGRQDLHIAEVEIPVGSSLEGALSSELQLSTRYNLVLIGVVDKEINEELHFAIGERDHRLDAGDILVILGPAREIRLFRKDVSNVGKN